MSYQNKLLKRNLVIGFGISLLLLLLSSVASFVSISNLQKANKLVDHTTQVLQKLEDGISLLKDAEASQRNYLLVGGQVQLSTYQRNAQKALLGFEPVRFATVDNPDQQQALISLNQLLRQRVDVLDKGVKDHRNRQPLDTLNFTNGVSLMQSIREVVTTMENREQRLLDERTAQYDEYVESTPVFIAVATLLAVLITIVFYLRVNKDANRRIKLQQDLIAKEEDTNNRINLIKGVAEKISAGDYTIRLDLKDEDSLGGIITSLNNMTEALDSSFQKLSDKEWIQTGIVLMNEMLLVEEDLHDALDKILSYIVAYVNADTAGLYLLENEVLTLSSGYALKLNEENKTIKSGNGVVGQAALQGKPKLTTNIDENNLTVIYTIGAVKPAHVLVLPLKDGRFVKGVIEIAKIHPFSSRQQEFLTSVSETIGIAISGMQNRKMLQNLLEETQSQAEELQSQHTEMENLNGELEKHAEKLQASEEELRVQQEELMQTNQELEERSKMIEEKNELITQRNIEIQTKAEELEQSTRYKSEFLANMSHELRTPLNSILLLSGLLQENNEENLSQDQVEYAKVIQSSGKGLLTLIDEILDLSKIEAGKMSLEIGSFSVETLVSSLSDIFVPLATQKNLQLILNKSEDVPETMETDKLRLEQILRNLLSNAIKFTDTGSVSLQISKNPQQPGYINFVVNDTGIGIAAEKHDQVFQEFQQADGTTRRRFGGTGLGLSISRRLASLLNGNISLKSELNSGSEFTLTIPCRLQPAEEIKKTPPIAKPVVEEWHPKNDEFTLEDIPQNIEDDRQTITNDSKVILVVEDDVNFATSLRDYARNRGYKCLVAVSGNEGLMLAQRYKPAGILLDVQLPVKNGWEVMDDLKQNVATKHIPVHIMSSYQVKTETLNRGAVDFINKPFAFDQLDDVFRKIENALTNDLRKVLILEENTKHSQALAFFFETHNIQTEIKTSIPDSLAALKNKDTKCVILDIEQPGHDFYQTLETIKKEPGFEKLPIIIFTSRVISNTEEMRIKQYADSIIVKTVHSYQRIIDEVSIFLHLMEENAKEAPQKELYKKLGSLEDVLKGKKVLITDDDVRNIFSLTKVLEKYEMNVITAIDGIDALSQLKATKDVDVVLMDIMMPEMDGYETIRRIRKDSRYKKVPIIAVTAKAMMGDKDKCIEAGASDYITKPVDVDQLISLLRVWLYNSPNN